MQDLQQKEKQKDMERRIHVYSDPNEDLEDDLLPEYDFSIGRGSLPDSSGRWIARRLSEDDKSLS